MKFRKKPVVIEAVQFQYAEYADNPLTFNDLPEWMEDALYRCLIAPFFGGEDYWYLEIRTLEDGPDGRAKHVASPGDWIIRGISGELYACKPDIFEQTYEVAE